MQKSLYFAIKTYITEGHICHCGYNKPEQKATVPCYIRTNVQTHMIICTVLLKEQHCSVSLNIHRFIHAQTHALKAADAETCVNSHCLDLSGPP